MKLNNILALLFLVFAVQAFAQENQFAFKRKISNISEANWYTVALPADLFKHCENDFRDLRILDLTGGDTLEVQYLLDILDTEIARHEVVLSSVNQSTKGNDTYITFLNSGYKVNYLELSFQERNYFATVKVEGSNDRKQWFGLAQDEKVFSVENSRERYASSIVNFPLTDYNYLRLTINSSDKLTFSSAAFRMDEIKLGSFDPIPSTFTVSTDKKSKRSIIEVTLDHYRPVSNITLDIDNQNDFYRHVTVETLVDSVKTERGWIRNYQTVSGNLITSFKPNQFSIPFTLTSHLRFTIENYDNPPLQIRDIKLTGARVQLRAKLKGYESYLFYGNDGLYQPTYDIEHFREKTPMQNAEVALGPEESIGKAPAVMSALFENKAWLWGILLAVIALLGFFTLRMMKSKPA
ncbi:MAG TPA: DUF3999 family protein [Chryseosolibacter sp.]